ncbi:hypothetical protein DPMN_180769 [Dreissena polymorpha]|uniref:Uncharacterized protein n=1 Tax=Dreissena polymorpha TaxID=45954 RepID=A0A9D4DDX4_DREPO|nr:hypothetical protein DPMN_180769 [Dreissena polymorpha]
MSGGIAVTCKVSARRSRSRTCRRPGTPETPGRTSASASTPTTRYCPEPTPT